MIQNFNTVQNDLDNMRDIGSKKDEKQDHRKQLVELRLSYNKELMNILEEE